MTLVVVVIINDLFVLTNISEITKCKRNEVDVDSVKPTENYHLTAVPHSSLFCGLTTTIFYLTFRSLVDLFVFPHRLSDEVND